MLTLLSALMPLVMLRTRKRPQEATEPMVQMVPVRRPHMPTTRAVGCGQVGCVCHQRSRFEGARPKLPRRPFSPRMPISGR